MGENNKQTGVIHEQGFIVPGGFNEVSEDEKEKIEKENNRDKK